GGKSEGTRVGFDELAWITGDPGDDAGDGEGLAAGDIEGGVVLEVDGAVVSAGTPVEQAESVGGLEGAVVNRDRGAGSRVAQIAVLGNTQGTAVDERGAGVCVDRVGGHGEGTCAGLGKDVGAVGEN